MPFTVSAKIYVSIEVEASDEKEALEKAYRINLADQFIDGPWEFEEVIIEDESIEECD